MSEATEGMKIWLLANPLIALVLIVIGILFIGIEISIITNMLLNPFASAILVWAISIAVVMLTPMKQQYVAVGAFILATIWTVFQIFLQSSSGVCTWPVIGGLLCMGQTVILAVPNLLFVFIPALVVFGVELWILTIAKGWIKD